MKYKRIGEKNSVLCFIERKFHVLELLTEYYSDVFAFTVIIYCHLNPELMTSAALI